MQSSTAQANDLSFVYDSTASSVQPLRSGLRNVWSKVKRAIKGDKPQRKTAAEYQAEYRRRNKATPESAAAFNAKQQEYNRRSVASKTDEEKNEARKKHNERRKAKRLVSIFKSLFCPLSHI